MNSFTLATYGTTDDYSWVTEGWSAKDYTLSQREEADEWAKTIAHTAIEFGHDMPDDISEIDPEDLEWEIKQIADHIRDWFDANADELKPAPTQEEVAAFQEVIAGGSVEATYGGGDYRAQVDENEDGGYTVSYFSTREMMPALKREHYDSEKKLIEAMRGINADASAWQPVELEY